MPPKTVHATGRCPSCHEWTAFDFLGEQRWPPEVARKIGTNEVLPLWTCQRCGSTISEPDIQEFSL